MPPLPRRLLALLLGLTAFAPFARAATFDVEIPHTQHDSFDKAAFHLWLPDRAGPVRGIAVVLDGINVDGRHLASRAQWQTFARDHALALVACYFTTDDLSVLTTYCEADRGSGRALLSALTALGRASGHPEFDTAPLFLLGFSAGGQFSYSFACFCPARVAAFVSNKGGIYVTPATAAARDIPGLFIAGSKDTTRRPVILKIYSDNRKLGARWCMAIEPNRGHETANANDLALPFFAAVLAGLDRPAAQRTGVVLDLDHQQLIAPGIPPKKTGITFWFPDEPTIAIWNTFMTKSH
jgi:poly(3-hydroxybutyrate) depolymerase